MRREQGSVHVSHVLILNSKPVLPKGSIKVTRTVLLAGRDGWCLSYPLLEKRQQRFDTHEFQDLDTQQKFRESFYFTHLFCEDPESGVSTLCDPDRWVATSPGRVFSRHLVHQMMASAFALSLPFSQQLFFLCDCDFF